MYFSFSILWSIRRTREPSATFFVISPLHSRLAVQNAQTETSIIASLRSPLPTVPTFAYQSNEGPSPRINVFGKLLCCCSSSVVVVVPLPSRGIQIYWKWALVVLHSGVSHGWLVLPTQSEFLVFHSYGLLRRYYNGPTAFEKGRKGANTRMGNTFRVTPADHQAGESYGRYYGRLQSSLLGC